jgi:hypothetical protein
MIEIENGIPLPSQSRGMKRKYPIVELEVGQSFLVVCSPEISRKRIMSVSSLCNRHARKTGFRYTCRVVDGGVRVWRVSK